MSQLAFDWPTPPNYAPEDFIISDCNSAACAFIDSWPQGGQAGALLTGPSASGKTHLAHRFAARMNAAMLDATQLGKVSSEELWGSAAYGIFENIETITDETALFHLLRHVETSGLHLLLTSRLNAQEQLFHLPDVRSRLLALPTASIDQPDEAMLHAFFTKAFADRQWRISTSVINYAVLRTERSFAGAQLLIGKLEKLISTTNREVTVPLIKPLV